MSDKKKKESNIDDLAQFKSLIGDTTGDEFSVDDIMAEYGKGRKPDRSGQEKVVAFPGGAPEPSPEEEPETEETVIDEDESQDEDRVIAFPEEESLLSAFLKDVTKKADDYANRMFQEDEGTDPEEVRRLEELIPGTDQEETEEEGWDLRWRRRPKALEPPPPDTDPAELARAYGKGLKGMRLRVLLLFFLSLAAVAQLLVPALDLVWYPPLDRIDVQSWGAVGLLGLGTLLAIDALWTGIARAFRGKAGMDTLTALACLFTLTDGAFLALEGKGERTPYSAVVLIGLWLLLHGTYHKRCALRLSCRTAAASAQPYRVTLDGGKWNGRDTYAKWSGTNEGFGSQIQADDGVQRIFRRYCPLLLLAAPLLALLATQGHTEDLLWGLSATFTATAAFGSALVYGRPFHKVARRLIQSGAALAGWPGVADSRKGDQVLITDGDLFPPGYVELNGFKVLGKFPMERVVACTATLIRDSGSGLTKLFHDQLQALGGLMRRAEDLQCHEGGGLSAEIRGSQVLVGSAAFMNLMKISLPVGLNVKNAVFCAIDGELAGIFALCYTLPDTVVPSLEELLQEKVGPVLATRDFNLIPAMLQQRFKLAADKMDFPPVERRRELSDPEQEHDGVLTALLCREGLYPLAEAVTSARRLRWATRLGAVLCCVGSTLGVLLAAYLVSVSAYGSLSPLNLLVYALTWLAPVWFLSGWVHRY